MTLSTATIASALNMGSKVITAADVAIAAVSTQRATFGAISNRLEHAIDNLTNVKTNTEAARSNARTGQSAATDSASTAAVG